MTRVTSDTERMRGFITSGFQDIVIDGLTIIGICAMLFVMNWELALLSLIPIPFHDRRHHHLPQSHPLDFPPDMASHFRPSTPCSPIPSPASR